MTSEWLLVETLGAEPTVVAVGAETKNMVPVSAYLRRDPNLMAVQAAVGETVRAGHSLSSLTPKGDRVIRTEVVQMTDGHIHGVHLWIGPPGADPPERLVPGPLKWDLTNGVATDTPESLLNGGRDPSVEATHGRAFAEDLPTRDLHPREAKVLSAMIEPEVGYHDCTTWNLTDHEGTPITVSFVARILDEPGPGGRDALICRAMNWRSAHHEVEPSPDDLAQRILNGLAEPGVHRALVDLRSWKLLKWLDEPAPFYDWRAREEGQAIVHPDDVAAMVAMTADFEAGAASCVLRLRAVGGGWTPVHVTAHLVKLDEFTSAGLLALRLPTAAEKSPTPGSFRRRARAWAEKAVRT